MRDHHSNRLHLSNAATSRGQGHAGAPAFEDKGWPVASPEAELLRVIEKTLQAQREQQELAVDHQPLVSRIETILGKRIEAANDVGTIAEPPAVEPPAVIQETHAIDLRPAAVARSKTAWRSAYARSCAVVGLLCAAGAAGGALMPVEPSRYRADAVFKVDAPADTRMAFARSAENALLSRRTIAAAVTALQLERDPEFAGSGSDALTVAVDLLSASGAAADPLSRAEASLAAAVQATTDAAGQTIGFKVVTDSAAKSSKIAAYFASTIARPVNVNHTDDGALKKANDEAQQALAAFTQSSGEGNVKVAVSLQQQIADADAELKAADQRMLDAKGRADRLGVAKLGDVLAGALPPETMSPSLEGQRSKYALAKSALAQLAASLGPRHPRLLAQQAEVDGLTTVITAELGRLQRDAGNDAKSAAAAKRALNDRRNTLIAQSRDTGVDVAKLTELRDKANAARTRMEDNIQTGSLSSEAGHLSLAGAPQITAVSSDRGPWTAPVLGALAGLVFGIAATWRQAKNKPTAKPITDPVVAEPYLDMPAPSLETGTPDEIEVLRTELSVMREKLKSYAAAS
jgi:uncharacterized protein involved in exopolysaccharide biosynthesis